ncbi:MAG: CoA pyrophosphatase [Desulfobacterales bacterium]|nr:CoA pyrophosphatase [Desulfobacterales bacterium]
MDLNRMQQLLTDKTAFIQHATEALQNYSRKKSIFPAGILNSRTTAAVLCLLGFYRKGKRNAPQPCFVFNKRSIKVRQAGDLCFPGGRMMPRSDFYFSLGLRLPFSPLSRWPCWRWWQKHRPQEARRLSLLLTAGLREGLEEMRLNPLGVRFLGPLPSQRLEMFQREIYPMAAWIERRQHFFPNREVEKIVTMPIRSFLDPAHYAACRISFSAGREQQAARAREVFPCFCFPDESEQEILWGATYRMVMNFLELVFDFRPPPLDSLPVVTKRIGEEYINRNP